MRAFSGCVGSRTPSARGWSCARPWRSSAVAPATQAPQKHRVVSARGWGDDVTFYPAKLADNQKNAKDQHILKVDAPDVATSYSKGGQYLQIKYGDSKPAFMAVANAPSDAQGGTLELLIKSIPDSTAEMLNGLDAGTEVSVSEVMGKGFPVDTVPPEEVDTVLIFATGTGIAPVKALIESGALQADKRKDVRLYFGTHDNDSTPYKDLIPVWESEYGIKVIRVLTERGEGYVQDVYAKSEPLADGSKACAVLCGQKDMAFAVKEILTAQGVPDDRFLTNF